MQQSFDLIVIGFGKAGKTIAMKRSAAGDNVALVERSKDMYGGSCINIACIPTKKLLEETAQGASLAQAQDARDELIGKLNAKNLSMAQDKGVTIIDGTARFSSPHEVIVQAGSDELILKAHTIVINTGSVPVWPEMPGIDDPRVFDSTGIQHISTTPAHLAIIGGGPIGLEFATLFAEQGAQVSVLERAHKPLELFDEDIAKLAQAQLEDQGVTFINDADISGFKNGDRLSVLYGDESLDVDAALLAMGRKAATESLNLDAAGIATTDRGEVVVDEYLRTNVEGIYAVGDVKGGPQFTYVSYDDQRIVLDQLSGRGTRSTSNRLIPTTTFINPPLSTVGMDEEEAEKSGLKFVVKKELIANMPIVPRPKIVNKTAGMAKFIIDEDSDKILGASLYCVDSQELINTVALAMRHHITATELGKGIYTHPSTSEIFNQLLE